MIRYETVIDETKYIPLDETVRVGRLKPRHIDSKITVLYTIFSGSGSESSLAGQNVLHISEVNDLDPIFSASVSEGSLIVYQTCCTFLWSMSESFLSKPARSFFFLSLIKRGSKVRSALHQTSLTLSLLHKTFSRRHVIYVSRKQVLTFHEICPQNFLKKICMVYQTFFSGKNSK